MSLPPINCCLSTFGMGDKILQWNIRGFQPTSLYILSILASQETPQSDCTKMSLSGHTVLCVCTT